MEVGQVRRIDIQSEMKQSYLDYAMSVIVSRALPDARDGLKPVHRRILHAMDQMGIRPNTPFRKSARIVGEVLGKYHPHGDMAVYDAMARLAQDFSVRYPLVEGQGNFGSIDGDSPAAMRYTEARMAPMATDMLADIDQDTVDFEDNFDGSLTEPSVLPARVPNLLVNGATGIAVGMSTSIPPHNLSEVVDACLFMLENWDDLGDIKLDDLMKYVQGPDFPTGGIILRDKKEGEGLIAAYASGRGKITLQARAHVESMGRGRSRIIVTELPYQTNKSNLIERIADQVRREAITGITDLRDESDRQGMRIVIELAKAADPEEVLQKLYSKTTMQGTFSMIMLALVEGQPRLLGLKQALTVFLDHRILVVRRRSEFELERARQRAHILEGIQTALKNLDDVIDTIRRSRDTEQASQRLQKNFKLSSEQAQAILDMPLRRLASLERKKVEEELKELKTRIKELTAILKSDPKLRALIAEELRGVQDRYGDRRRTLIASPGASKAGEGPLTAGDLTPSKDVYVVVTENSVISRTTTARMPRISGRKSPRLVINANVRDTLYLFTTDGQAASLQVHIIPETDESDQGIPLSGLVIIDSEAEIATGVAVPDELLEIGAPKSFLLFGTRQAMVKKTELGEFPGPSARSFEAIRINRKDALAWVELTTGRNEVMLFSDAGMAIRFPESEVRPMGLSAAGVNGMRLDKSQQLVGMSLIRPDQVAFLITADGRAKHSKLDGFPAQGRYGKGVLAWPSKDKVPIAGAAVLDPEDRLAVILARRANRSVKVNDAPQRARSSAGSELFELPGSDRVVEIRPALARAGRVEANTKKQRRK